MGLTSKERMQVAMDHDEPDKVPFHSTFVPEMEMLLEKRYAERIKEKLIGIEDQGKYTGASKLDMLFEHDMLLLAYGISTGYYRKSESDTYIDEWGITWKKIPYESLNGKGYYTEIVKFPLADDRSLENYMPPDPADEDMGYAEEVIKKYGTEYYICGS